MKRVYTERNRSGFTLIELLIVIAIIGILATLIMSNFNSARERTRDVQRKSDLDQIKKALRMAYNDANSYPPALTFGAAFLSAGGDFYMKLVPHDPSYDAGDSTPIDYQYAQLPTGQDFCLMTNLENESDGDIAKSSSRCSDCIVPEYNYYVCAD